MPCSATVAILPTQAHDIRRILVVQIFSIKTASHKTEKIINEIILLNSTVMMRVYVHLCMR